MSDTKSFKSIVNDAMEKVYSNHEFTVFDVAAILGMLSGAHDYEMEELRKTYERERERYE